MVRRDSPSRRSVRLADIIQRELALMLQEEIQDPRLELVTISGVRLNTDLSIAKVLYTCTDDPIRLEEIALALNKAKGYLRTLLGKRLNLRSTPELRFERDIFLEDMVYDSRHAS
ncbi:30S ribosome-binding factor RbfA [Desulfonatronum thioautotrophicum]|uniref:30S ribosome-binding factor RbfA n=1 Tax=Desulfonatronum thioautotrophicum TaxID=617001 RepID=UPI0005EBB140|nr:30S ribosome-binding factor RbfA [Desulfonatronum thioautotrophicum]